MTMALTNSFEVPTPVEVTWRTLLDVERVALCLPGAQLEEMDGDTFTGRVKVKLGPITMSFKGAAAFTELDPEQHRAVLAANGKEIGGTGSASAVMTMQVASTASGVGSEVVIATDLAVTGKAAKFGRGVITEVAGRLVDQFATALTAELAAGAVGPQPGQTGAPDAVGDPWRERPSHQENAFQVLGGAGWGMARVRGLARLSPRGSAVAALFALAVLLSYRRPSRSPARAVTDLSGGTHG